MEGRVDVKILCGKDLLGMDFSGKSDPYVEVFQGSQKLYKTAKKSNTLNPEWNEQFSFHMQDQSEKMVFKVIDRDLPDKDDFMGEALLDLSTLGINRSEEFTLALSAGKDDKLARKAGKECKSLGSIVVRVCTTDVHDGSVEKLDFFTETVKTSSKNSSMSLSRLMSDSSKPIAPYAMVHIVVVQAKGLISPEHSINPFCKVSLGSIERKTKIVKGDFNPIWKQGFDIAWFKGRDDFVELVIHTSKINTVESSQIGRTFVNLRELREEESHNLWLPITGVDQNSPNKLQETKKEGELNMNITISGKMEEVIGHSQREEEANMEERFAISNTFSNLEDVGHLQVKVIRAEGLEQEFIGKRNPFVVLKIGNSRVQTHSCKATINPEWNRTFRFNIKDVSEVLEISAFDDDDNIQDDFPCDLLGRLQVPLLSIESGKEKWYRLKDSTLRNRAKGEAPKILLQIKFTFNFIRASSCVFKPKSMKHEENEQQVFELSKFKQNAGRIMRLKNRILMMIEIIINIFEWKNPFVSFSALIIIPAIIWHFDIWMVPAFLILLLTYELVKHTGINKEQNLLDEDEDTDNQDEGNLSMMETVDMLKQKALWMQELMGEIASPIESLENVFNFSVPYISWFIFVFFILITIFLYFVPLRLLVLVWVVNRFRKGLIKNRTDTNEVINFLSRVPDNEELKNYEELHD